MVGLLQIGAEAPKKAAEEWSKLPSAVRLYLRATGEAAFGGGDGEETPFTEEDFSDEELAALQIAAENALARGSTTIEYNDYPVKDGFHKDGDNIIDELQKMIDDPARSVMFTLGTAKITPEGTIEDKYDFAGSKDADISLGDIGGAITSPNPRAIFNLIGNAVGLRAGTGREVKVRIGDEYGKAVSELEKQKQVDAWYERAKNKKAPFNVPTRNKHIRRENTWYSENGDITGFGAVPDGEWDALEYKK